MEDGRQGDLSISDIVLFRIVANMRLGRFSTSNGQGTFKRSWWRSTVENVAGDDSDAREELQRLLSYLDQPPEDDCDDNCAKRKYQTAIIFSVNLERACVALFAPLRSTADQVQQLRRLHERFLDIVIEDLRFGLTLKGDYQAATYQCSLQDFNASEIRADRSRHVIASRAAINAPPDALDFDNLVDKADADAPRDPLLVLCISTNTPKKDECDLELVVFLDIIDVVLDPDCQWITRAKQLLKNISSFPQFAQYWSNLTMAYINSAASRRLSFLAKTETAGFEHKNMDVDITIQCPVLRIGDVDGSFLEINLGIANVKTEKLAGVASTKLADQALREIEIERLNTSGYMLDSIEEASSALETSSSPRFSQRHPLLTRKAPPEKSGAPSSSWSVDSRNRYRRAAPSVSGSMTFEDMTFRGFDSSRMSGGIGHTRATDAMFYDLYRFQLTTGKMRIVSKAGSKEVSPGFEVMTTIQTSVIPADHTLSRFRSHSAVSSFSLSLSLPVILQFVRTIETWKSVLNREAPAPAFSANDIDKIITMTDVPTLVPSMNNDIGEESASEVDENEFFDARDGDDSIMGDSNGVWFDDNWIADAESVISRPTPDRRGRPRQSSISDVSSASDQSVRRRLGQGYLSAENLAKLDEAAAEEDDISESFADIDNDTFHSALTAGGQADLARELDEDIQKAEANVLRLKAELEATKISLDGLPSTESSRDRRNVRRALKLNLERSVAEMHALRALQLDLESSAAGESGANEGNKDLRSAAVSANARNLLNAKKKSGDFLVDDSHNLTANLNRQLFQASIIFDELSVTMQLNGDEEISSLGGVPQIFEVCASQTGIAVFHSVNDTKTYLTVDFISAKLGGTNDTPNLPQFPLLGGTNDQLMEMQLPHHLPQHIASSMEEKFVRLSFHSRNRRREGSPAEIVKLRVVFGDVEITPHKRSLVSLLSFFDAIARNARRRDSPGSKKAPTSSSGLLQKVAPNIGASSKSFASNPTHKYYDLAVRLASIRVAISREDCVVGAFAIAETSLRYVHCPAPVAFKCRSQLDFKCANFQVLSISSLRDGRGTECFGRSDPYGHLIIVRLRRQLVPALEQGGWVVDAEKTMNSEGSVAGHVAWNVHVGVRINPFTAILSPTDLSRCSDGIRELRGIIAGQKSVPLATAHAKPEQSGRALIQPPVRWRVDIVQQRSSLILAKHKPPPDELSLELILSWSLLTSIEEVGTSKKYRMARIGIVDMSLARHSDEWPLLEQFSVLCRLQIATSESQTGHPLERATLKLPPDSLWNEISALMHRNEWDALPKKPVEDNHFSIKVTPVRINVCVPVCVTLASSVHPFYALIQDDRNSTASYDLADNTATAVPVGVEIQLSMMALEARLLRETDNRPISFAEPLVSFSTVGVIFEYSRGQANYAKIVVEKAALYDLSVRPGVLVLGEDLSPKHTNKTSFVVAELQIEHPRSEARTIRVAVDWGRIQCLVVPSLIRHLLAFRENLSRQIEPGDVHVSKGKKLGAPPEVLSFKGDMNILLSARAEAFELLVASRSVAAYVHEQSPEPMGAVAFRWSAALNAAFAGASTISGLKSPCSTLDPDSSFSDAPDHSLFKEFCHRYLDQSSGFLTAPDEVGLSLGSAFTVCVTVKVTGFQAIRTNIESRKRESRRLCFLVVPPAVGERRITNSIDCEVKHRVSGAIMCATDDARPRIECSHLLELESNFLDVLAYISQSNTGVTEAFRVNVKPIVDMLKRKEEHQPRKPDSLGHTQVSSSSFVDVLLRGSLVFSVRVQGLGITCVPGGATRLTEVRQFPTMFFFAISISAQIGLQTVP